MGTYMLIGVPIYACAVGQFAGVMIKRAVEADHMTMLKQPIDFNEFRYCANILSPEGSETLSVGTIESRVDVFIYCAKC